MVSFDTDNYSRMFEYFSQLNYLDKLNFFQTHFGIIPFTFPDFNVEISWYNHIDQITLLTENFHKEIPKKFTCEKIFIENSRIIKFTVQPISPKQRIQYNRIIVSAFLSSNDFLKKKLSYDLQTSKDSVRFLSSQINIMTSVQEWIRYSIEAPRQKINLRDQFLQIFFNGLNFYHTGKEITIQKRRKFIELYLFSQGFFFAEYLSMLKLMLKEKQNCYSNLSTG